MNMFKITFLSNMNGNGSMLTTQTFRLCMAEQILGVRLVTDKVSIYEEQHHETVTHPGTNTPVVA